MEKILKFLSKKKNRINTIAFLTFISTIIIIISLTIIYMHSCKHKKYRVDYNENLNTCVCKTFLTDTTLTNYIAENGFSKTTNSQWITMTDSITMIDVSFDGPEYYDFLVKNNIPDDPKWYVGGLSYKFPISNWNTQLHSMDIVPVKITSKPIKINFNFVDFTYTQSQGTGTGNIIPGYCNKPKSNEFQVNITDYCFEFTINLHQNYPYNTTDYLGLLNKILAVQDAIINDLEVNLFKTKNIQYCWPDYCLVSMCNDSNNIFQLLLMVIGGSSGCFTIIQVIMHFIERTFIKKSSDTQMSQI